MPGAEFSDHAEGIANSKRSEGEGLDQYTDFGSADLMTVRASGCSSTFY